MKMHSTAIRAASNCVVQRRSPNGLSGWVAYNLASTRYRNALTGEEFAADYDQRHTLNVYGVYRFSDRMSFSSRFRAGSNFPVPGYYESRETRLEQSGVLPQHNAATMCECRSIRASTFARTARSRGARLASHCLPKR